MAEMENVCAINNSAVEHGSGPFSGAEETDTPLLGVLGVLPQLTLGSVGELPDHQVVSTTSAGQSASSSYTEAAEETGYRFDSVEDWVCAICREKIAVEETAQIRGCEHSYCVTCILRWASYKPEPWCPQCRLPFTFVYLYKSIDGSLQGYLHEESVCLLLRAPWFQGVPLTEVEEPDEYHDDDEEEEYFGRSGLRICNRRWGDNGFVRAGRREARPRSASQSTSPVCSQSSSVSMGKGPAEQNTGRRAKRAQKRLAADKAQSSRSQQSGRSI